MNKETILALKKLFTNDSPTCYYDAEDSVGFCGFCRARFGHKDDCDWMVAKEKFQNDPDCQKGDADVSTIR